MLLYISSFFIFIFVSFNLFFHAHLNIWLKLLGVSLIFLVSMKYEIYQFIGGAFFAPSLPRDLIIVLEALYGALLILFFLLIIWNIYLVGNWILAKTGMPIPQRLPVGYIKCGIVVLACVIGFYGTWQAVKVPTVHTLDMKIANLPEQLEGFKIIQLSDLHIGPILKKEWLEKVVDKVNALHPDLIVLTGDYVDGHVDEIFDDLTPLANLKAPYGVFGVTGNHEYYWNASQWLEALKQLDIAMLQNEHRALDINGATLIVAGIPDLVAENFNQLGPDLQKALANAPEGLRLLLAHQPKKASEYSSLVDIHLAGHTHGGIIFFLQPLIARFNAGFVDGPYSVNEKTLYVSPGTGLWNGISCRIGVPSEITEFILKKK